VGQTFEVLRQAGVIPFEVAEGELRILLVTSRESGRWVIPKGNVEPKLTPAKSAEKEAYEEAGIEGELISETSLGFFTYLKRMRPGESRPASVEVFLLRVAKQCKKWPEMKQRKCGWFSVQEAAELVDEPGLSRLLLRLEEMDIAALSAKS
jgi:8-oxo-dGTP pyrophosphatase MutT (NUDIX family)